MFSFTLVFLLLQFNSSLSFLCLSPLLCLFSCLTLICLPFFLCLFLCLGLSLSPLPSPIFPHLLSSYHHCRNTDPWFWGPPTRSPHPSFQCQGLTKSSSFSQPVFFGPNSPSDEGVVGGGSLLPPRPLHCHPSTNGFWAQPWFLLPL